MPEAIVVIGAAMRNEAEPKEEKVEPKVISNVEVYHHPNGKVLVRRRKTRRGPGEAANHERFGKLASETRGMTGEERVAYMKRELAKAPSLRKAKTRIYQFTPHDLLEAARSLSPKEYAELLFRMAETKATSSRPE